MRVAQFCLKILNFKFGIMDPLQWCCIRLIPRIVGLNLRCAEICDFWIMGEQGECFPCSGFGPMDPLQWYALGF